MLIELRIKDFAIIDRIDLLFQPGLITFTGETGAGKSIIIDAVETLLGGRADSTQVRSGAESATIEGVFQICSSIHSPVSIILDREDLSDEPGFVTFSREIRLSGRNQARINGHSVSASILREIGDYLVDVHGQSEHLSLLRVNQHIELLDRFAASVNGDEHLEILSSYRQIYQNLKQVEHELETLRRAERDVARQTDILKFQINEIDSANLHLGEEKLLNEERIRLANAESLSTLVQEVMLLLDEGSPQEPAAIDLIGRATNSLNSLARLDPSKSDLSDNNQMIFENITDLIRKLRIYLETIEFNPKRLDQVEDRLALIQTLKRKYGDTIPEILAFAEKSSLQLDQITHAAERIEELETKRLEWLQSLTLKGSILSGLRRDASINLEKAVEAELSELQMPGAHLKVNIEQLEDPDGIQIPERRRIAYYPNGLERVEFLIAPNPGEGFKPLAKIASGGETSRLMLAIKNVLAHADNIPTLIFDEIDQGIGGRVGSVVGWKLWQLGQQHQVICITHLPQLAAFGAQHFHIEKSIQSGRTITTAKLLEDEERLVELAQMLGSVSEGTLISAHELMQFVEKQTVSLPSQ